MPAYSDARILMQKISLYVFMSQFTGERRVEEYKLVYISDLMNYIATCRKDNMT